ncbi:MAG: methyltransferase domain-containing protein [Phycisphaerales bacterium]|nr:methyltransferase domain-containing protein [Phycisphaerales bacterium]
MNQDWLTQRVLKDLDSVPTEPNTDHDYLSYEQAEAIVDETLNYLGAHSNSHELETEYTYIKGHRKRLAHTLSMIPKANVEGQRCLDVGSYGYMGLWLTIYLGYSEVIGIEWHPDVEDKIIHREIRLNDKSTQFKSYNFDITQSVWPIDEEFDTVLFLEVLEHINQDPMGVMAQIHERLKLDGTLMMSVPNAISYKAFHEFLAGMPPWTYWFYEPDLSHEPRHCFEYTPIVFKTLIGSAGMQENAFKTIYAYSEVANEQDTIEIASAFGIDVDSFGETMIIHATKNCEDIQVRYPDVLYSPDGYYKNVYPLLRNRLQKAIEHYRDHTDNSAELEDLKEQVTTRNEDISNLKDLLSQEHAHAADVKEQLNSLLYTCDVELSKQRELQADIENHESKLQHIEDEKAKIELKLKQTRTWALTLQKEKQDLNMKVNELLFTCDCFLKKEQENESLAKAVEIESKTAYEARDHALSLVQDSNNWAESLSKENADLTNQVNELLFACDCYLQQINDPQRCVQVVRERRFRAALETSKAVARKTPVLRTALRPVYRSTKKFIKRRI